MLDLLRLSPEFRRLFVAHSVSRAGDAFNTVALVVLVFDLTNSGLGVAGAVTFEVLPVLLIAPVAGLAADRLPRRSVMIGADVCRALVAIVLVAVLAIGAVLAIPSAFVGLAVGGAALGALHLAGVPMRAVARGLIDAALEGGGPDNITVVVAEAIEADVP